MNLPGESTAAPRPALTKPLLATVAITVAAAAAVLVWAIVAGIDRERPLGDGRDARSYGFELGTLPDDPGFAVSGQPRDFMPSLDAPELLRGDEIADYNRTHRRRPVVSTDRVVGVVIGDAARAYPVPLLEAHEIVNDVLGGVPIAVSFSPLADAAVVFDRRIGDRTREFALSGLMLDSTHLLYDRQDPGASAGSPSLWSPLRLRSVGGPTQGEELRAIPRVSLARWSDWLAAHPETTVALGDEGSRLRDRRIDYTHELTRPGLTFPVAGLDAASMAAFSEQDWQRLKAPVLAVRGPSGSWQVIDLEALGKGAAERTIELDGAALRVRLGDDARSAVVLADGESSETEVVVIPCLRFAADRLVADRAPAHRPDE